MDEVYGRALHERRGHQQRERRSDVSEGEGVDRRGDVIASNGHSLAEQTSARQAGIGRVQLPDGRNLSDRDVIECAEASQNHPAKQNSLKLNGRKLSGKNARIVGESPREICRADRPPCRTSGDDQAGESADHGRRRPYGNPMGEVYGCEHHGCRPNQDDEDGMVAHSQGGNHECPNHAKGDGEAG